MKYCENCGKELANGVCPNCNGDNTQNNNNIQSQNKTNAYSIVGFVLSFFISIAGLIVSIIGLKKSKEMNNGKGLSIAGIVISIVGLVFKILIIAIAFLGVFFAVNAYPEMKDAIEDAVEDNVSDWDYGDSFKDTATTKIDENGNTYYSIDLTKYEEDDIATFDLSDDYKIRIEINNVDNKTTELLNLYNIDLYVNDTKAKNYSIDSNETLNFYLVGKYLVNIMYRGGVIHSEVINSYGNVRDLHNELKDDFAVINYKILDNKLFLDGSRYIDKTAPTTFAFQGGQTDSCEFLDKNVIVEYTNEYDLSSDVLEPTITNEKTLGNYITENNITCNN